MQTCGFPRHLVNIKALLGAGDDVDLKLFHKEKSVIDWALQRANVKHWIMATLTGSGQFSQTALTIQPPLKFHTYGN